MTLAEIYDQILRQLNKPMMYFPPELLVSFANQAIRHVAKKFESWWIKFEKDTEIGTRIYKLASSELGFNLYSIRYLFYDEKRQLEPDYLNQLLIKSATGDPQKYCLFFDDETPFIILYPTPTQVKALAFFCRGFTKISTLDKAISLPEYTHDTVIKYIEYLVYETLKDSRWKIRLQEFERDMAELNKEYKDKVPIIGDKTEIVYVEYD